MSKNQNNIPVLRFPEFENTWEKFKLSQIADINPKSKELPDSFIYIDLESVNSGTLTKETRILKSEAPSRAQRLLNKEDILYQTVRPYQKNNYFFNKHNSEYVASTGYAQIRTVNNSAYLYHYLHTNYFVKKVLLRCTGTSYPAISSSDLAKIKMFIPKLSEQQKIASFLTSVDKRIQALEQKKELLEQYKKGVMQKIFNREIRFQPGTVSQHLPLAAEPTIEYGGNNSYPDWEVKKLGEIATITTGSSNREDSSLIGEYTFFDRSQDIRTSDRYLFDKEAIIFPGEGQKFVPKYFKGKFDLHQRAYAIFDFKETDGLYLYYLLSYSDRHLQSQAVGSTVKSLRLPMFKTMPINFPCLEEQQKIAGFLSAIDTKIEAVTSQIDHSKTFKKGLLQKMFV